VPSWRCFQSLGTANCRKSVQDAIDEDRGSSLRCGWDLASLTALAKAGEELAGRRMGSSEGGSEDAWRIDDFVATQLAFAVFWVLAHLRRVVALSVVGAVSILGAVAFYPFQPIHLLLLLIWIVVLGAAVSAIIIYTQHGRDEVLSWLSSTEPGQVSLDASYIARFVSLGAAPIVALLALEFPAFGHFVARWLGPVFGAIK